MANEFLPITAQIYPITDFSIFLAMNTSVKKAEIVIPTSWMQFE